MSRPNHALALGRSRACFSTAALGSTLVNSCGTAAITMNSTMSVTDTQKMGLRLSCRQASEARERPSSAPPPAVGAPASAPTAMVDASVMADPRVEHAVQEIDEQVHDKEDEHQDGHGAHDTHRVAVADAGEQEATDALDVEDALGHDGATEQAAEVGTDEGDDRDERVAQGVD